MAKSDTPPTPRDFAKLSAFDGMMRKLVKVPKEAVAKREKATRTPRVTDERK